jgi:23S rRNA (cytosine1962-C5)-methyltransferase/23S rRNA (guanine2445-N2)-methyltransferase / 23S rRNA (guanine2069-N7)-methyltransferase
LEGIAVILNRLLKNWKKLGPWAKRQNIDVFRLYDRDIPEFPFLVDVYADYVLVFDKTDKVKDEGKNHLPLLIEALVSGLKFAPDKIVIKKRNRQEGKAQYEKLENRNQALVIREHEAYFEVNLYDYLDTGLFLDHRPMRQKFFKEISEFKTNHPVQPTMLNLFCYTGSVSVFAALAGAKVTSVDMSATYLEWARRNFKLNSLSIEEHLFIQEDVLSFLEKPLVEKYDYIFLDPPTFSNSKRMHETFEVERDQETVVKHCMLRLKQGGVLYFSNNKRDFRLSANLKNEYLVKDISELSIPQDCHDKKIHHCFALRLPRVE